MDIRKIITKYLREIADKIDEGECEVSDTEAVEMLSLIAHEPISKEQSCIFLNISRSKFDELVRNNMLPKGRKRQGFKELCWYKDELELHKNR